MKNRPDRDRQTILKDGYRSRNVLLKEYLTDNAGGSHHLTQFGSVNQLAGLLGGYPGIQVDMFALRFQWKEF